MTNRHILLGILLLAGLTRFWQLPERFIFSGEANNVLYAWEKLWQGQQSPLVGLEATGYVHHLFTPPWYLYALSLVMLVANGDPLVLAFVQSALGVFGTYLIYRVGVLIHSNRLGLIAAFSNSVWITAVNVDRFVSSVGLVPFASIVSMYLGMRAWREAKRKWFIALGVWSGFSLSLHYQMFVSVFIWISVIFWKQRKHLWATIVPILISFLPLIIFDLRHQLFNLKGFWYAAQVIAAGKSPYSSVHYLFQFHRPLIMFLSFYLHRVERLAVIGLALFGIVQLVEFFPAKVTPNYAERKELIKSILQQSDRRLAVYFKDRSSYDYRYLLRREAKLRHLDPDSIEIYEPWQPTNSATVLVEGDRVTLLVDFSNKDQPGAF